MGGGAGIGALPVAALGADAEQLVEPGVDLAVADRDLARPRARRRVLPFRQGGEDAAFGAFGLGDAPRDLAAPAPAQADQRLGDRPCPVPLAPVGAAEGGEQGVGGGVEAGAGVAPPSPGAGRPSARASPPGVGTAKRAGWTKANSSRTSSPDSSG